MTIRRMPTTKTKSVKKRVMSQAPVPSSSFSIHDEEPSDKEWLRAAKSLLPDEPFTCPWCSFPGKGLDSIREHINSDHIFYRPISCGVCDDDLPCPDLMAFKKHCEDHFHPRPYEDIAFAENYDSGKEEALFYYTGIVVKKKMKEIKDREEAQAAAEKRKKLKDGLAPIAAKKNGCNEQSIVMLGKDSAGLPSATFKKTFVAVDRVTEGEMRSDDGNNPTDNQGGADVDAGSVSRRRSDDKPKTSISWAKKGFLNDKQ